MLDLDGDGVEADAITYFDHEGDGWSELSRWSGEDDGTLVWDRNGDGVINDGSELFGNNTVLANGWKATHGFSALADLDSNGDGVVDASDASWSELQVLRWTDANGNGIMDEGEEFLVSLEELGIASLNTGYVNSDYVDESGNEHRQVGSYTKSDGSVAEMTDVWFVTASSDASYDRSQIPAHSEAIAGLPDIRGYGRVYDLRDAMALDDAVDAEGNSLLRGPYYNNARTEARSLRELVEAFASEEMASNKAGREALAEQILLRWAGAEGLGDGEWAYGIRRHTTAWKVAVVEAFQGEQWRQGESYRNPDYSTSQRFNRGYLNHLEGLYGELMLQTHLSDLSGSLSITSLVSEGEEASDAVLTEIDDYRMDFSAAVAILSGEDNARRGEFLRSLAAMYGNSEWMLSGLEASAPSWVYEYRYRAEYLERGVFDSLTSGSRGRPNMKDKFIGDCGCSNDGEGINAFQTTDGGSDYLEGRGGNDIYHLGYGTGHDRIEEVHRDSDYGGDTADVIRIAPGISSDKVRLSRVGNNLIVGIAGADGVVHDSFEVAHFYSNAVARIERVEAEDGTVWVETDMEAAPYSSGRGSTAADVYDGGRDGQDRVLQGGSGADVYLLGRVSGHDVVDEMSYRVVGADALGGDIVRLSAGLGASDVRLSRGRHDLLIELVSVDGSSVDSSLTIRDYYVREESRIERVELSDGTLVWGSADFASVVLADESTGDDVVDGLGRGRSDVLSGFGGGSDTLRGRGGNDVYLLGLGSGDDVVDERYRNSGNDLGDVVRLSAGITASQVSLSRTQHDLVISLSDASGEASASLTIRDHYAGVLGQIERIELSDGTQLWGVSDFAELSWTPPVYSEGTLIVGTSGDDLLYGSSLLNDQFDANAGGNDRLYGYAGNDVYYLDWDTGHDRIIEHSANSYGHSRGSGDLDDRIVIESGIVSSSVRLVRSNDGNHLYIQLLDATGSISASLRVENYYRMEAARIESVAFSDGTVWGESDLLSARIVGSAVDDRSLRGRDETNDIFDANAGGDDDLHGYGGDDVYYLDWDTGHDRIFEYIANGYGHSRTSGDTDDRIVIETGIESSSVRLVRSGDGAHLYVQLLDVAGNVSASLMVNNQYTSSVAKIESIEFGDGTVWDEGDILRARIMGTSGNDPRLQGHGLIDDIFDSSAGGDDNLYGCEGNDTYLLGLGTGHDRIFERYSYASISTHGWSGVRRADGGDDGDSIQIKSGIAVSSVRLVRSNDGQHLYVQLLNDASEVSDSLEVYDYYVDVSARIESIEFGDGAVWGEAEMLGVVIMGGVGNDYNLRCREALAEQILLRWAGAEGLGDDDWAFGQSRHTMASEIAVIEAFQGEQWRRGESYRNPTHETGQKVSRDYQIHRLECPLASH